MTRQAMRQLVGVTAVIGAVFVPSVVDDHGSIWPRQSAAGATEKYTPTEGKVTAEPAANST